jgi:hypothetical protein
MSCSFQINSVIKSNYYEPNEIIKKFVKYLLHGLIVSMTSKWISKYELTVKQLIIIGLTSSISFLLFDFYTPCIVISPNNLT